MNTDDHKRKFAELEETIRKQGEEHEAKAKAHEQMTLLDRIAARVPEMDLDQHEIEWTTLPDGAEAVVVDGGGFDGGGFDGGSGIYFANVGKDVHAVGSMAPAFPAVGCVVIRPDRTRVLAQVMPDPLAKSYEQG